MAHVTLSDILINLTGPNVITCKADKRNEHIQNTGRKAKS